MINFYFLKNKYFKLIGPAVVGLLIIITLLAYVKIFNAEFVYDDFAFIVNNKDIQSFTPFSKFFLSPDIFTGSAYHTETGGGRNWRPVASFAFAAEFALFGKNPSGFHSVSIFLHILNLILVYLLVMKVTKRVGVASLTAALWALHPTATEAVSWVANQSSLIFFGFFILSVLTLLKFSESDQKRHLFISCLFFGFSLLSKEIALGGIFIILFIFLFYFKKRLKFFLTFVLMGAAYLFIRYQILGTLGDHALRGSFFENLLLAPTVFAKYLGLTVWPVNLMLDYTNFPLPSGIADFRVIAGILLFMILSALFYFGVRKSIYSFSFGIVWFLAFLLPVSQIIPFQDIVGERFLYAPLVGFFLSAASGFGYLLSHAKSRFNFSFNKLTLFLFLLILSTFFVLTFNRNNDWLNSENLWLSVLRLDAGNERALQNISASYLQDRNADKLIEFSERLLNINKDNKAGRLHLAVGKIMKGRYKEAELELLDLIKKYPDFQEAKNNLSVLYQQLGNQDSFINSIIVSPVIDDENIINSGIFGSIVLGEKPYEASLDILSAAGNPVISVRSHSNGTFQIPLKPGIYMLKPLDPDGPITPARSSYNFTVSSGQWLQVKIEYK
mgnify:CR=1 FL=1